MPLPGASRPLEDVGKCALRPDQLFRVASCCAACAPSAPASLQFSSKHRAIVAVKLAFLEKNSVEEVA
jgi:hypothetical protein